MKVLFVAATIVAIIAAAPVAAPAGASSALVAASRCNGRTVNDLNGQVRLADQHPPGGKTSQMAARYQELDDILTQLNQEQGILDSVCATDAEKAPFLADLAATAAWALALEADLAGKLDASCPAAAVAVPEALLAQAWLNLANTVNAGPAGQPPKPVLEVAPKIQKRAAALGMSLPSYADTSAYWRDGLSTKGHEAAQSCAPPGASPSPKPT